MTRKVLQLFESIEISEGVGAKVRRSIGTTKLRNLDPFLLLDIGIIQKPAGFPDHPHRGFETVTYVLSGAVSHEDFKGHKGIINSGDLQWMTAGRGIAHSEMPYGDNPSKFLQLWVNLPRKYKMIEPNYQELKHEEIPIKSENGVEVKVIAGESMGIKSNIYTITPTIYLDFKLKKGSKFTQEVPEDWNCFVVILNGTGVFGDKNDEKEAKVNHTVVLSKGNSISFRNDSNDQLHFVLIGGQPLNEPIVQHGPFVMNTNEEISKTIDDYQNCRNGFENVATWISDEKRNRK